MEITHYFENGKMITGLFAGNLTHNIRAAEQKLGARYVTRDNWIKIVAEDKETTEKSRRFFSKLDETYRKLSGHHIPQREFESILSAFHDNAEEGLKQYHTERIKVGPRKNSISPKTEAQSNYLRAICEKEIVFGIGPAGTGKTYLAMAMAVSELLSEKVGRIILTRPAREAGENLGFLPGNLEEKILPYLRPLYDALYDMLDFEDVASLIEKNIIEIAPLAFMRGRTLNNAFVILDEAQNTTRDQMLMFLTRIGFNSKCVITGDPSQNDLGADKVSGLLHAQEILTHIEEIGFCTFTTRDIVRHSLIEKIVRAYQNK